MSRGFWAGVMLFSLAVTGVAGWYVYMELQTSPTVEVPLRKVDTAPVAKQNPEPAMPAAKENEEKPASNTETVATTEESPEGRRNILFTYRNSTAKTVFIVGDFNKWFRQPMNRKDGIWSVSVPMTPGTYEYRYVVDNKRVRDPNNKNVSDKGHSVLTVKPSNAG